MNVSPQLSLFLLFFFFKLQREIPDPVTALTMLFVTLHDMYIFVRVGFKKCQQESLCIRMEII